MSNMMVWGSVTKRSDVSVEKLIDCESDYDEGWNEDDFRRVLEHISQDH